MGTRTVKSDVTNVNLGTESQTKTLMGLSLWTINISQAVVSKPPTPDTDNDVSITPEVGQ